MLAALILGLSLQVSESAEAVVPARLLPYLANPFAPPVTALPLGGSPLAVQWELNVPGRRWKEGVVIVYPQQYVTPTPVLTVFHAFGETPIQVLTATTLVDAAAQRGWLVVIPLGAHPYNYGIDYSQLNIDDVFDFIASPLHQQAHPVVMDLDRIYAVGFSMGGGAATSFAARHQDPTRVNFAVVVNHTGSTSLRNTYELGNVPTLFESPLMFGGTPEEQAFRYKQSSTIDIKQGNVVDPATDMARNLARTRVIHWVAAGDPLQYLLSQSHLLHQRLLTWGAPSDWRTVSANEHSWATLPAADQILDEIELYRRAALPVGVPVHVLADRPARWHHFTIGQNRAKEFTPFTWETDPTANEVSVTAARNLGRVEFRLSDLGLSAASPLRFELQNDGAHSVEIAIHGFPSPPSGLTRNGIPLSVTWSAGALLIRDPDATLGPVYVVTP